MNTQEFIDSGILELYAAGGLSQPEIAEVEIMATRFPEVKVALDEALQAIEAYALTYAQVPAPELEDKIISHLELLEVQQPSHEAKVIPVTLGTGSTLSKNQMLQWAASVLLVISAFTNFYLYRQVQEKDQELVATRQLTRQYVYQANQLEQKNFQTENLLQFFRHPQTKTVPLKAVASTKNAAGTVFWNGETKEVFFDNRNLPSAPAGKQYQLWALADGKPIDAGMVALASLDMQSMKPIEQAEAFAVTLEPEGGSLNPTLSEMVVMGSI